MSPDEVALIVRDFDSAITILSEKETGIEVEMTEQQAGDFMTSFTDWQAEKIVYADINKPAIPLDNLRKKLQSRGPNPS